MRLTKIGALSTYDHDMWIATMRLAFEGGRTNEEAVEWLKEKGYGEISPRQLREQVRLWQKELGSSIRTERPPDPPVLGPKRPCKGCKGFGRLAPDGAPSLKTSHAACGLCAGSGQVREEVRA